MPKGIYKHYKGRLAPHFGKLHKEETKKHWSKIRKGIHNSPATEFKKGQKHHKNWLSAMNKMRGKNCYKWKGGITLLRNLIRSSFKYRQWRSDVFTRDDFTCQNCGVRSGNGKAIYLEAHHLKEFFKILEKYKIKTFEDAMDCEELWNINNGRTLCKKCHNLTKNGRKTN